MVARLSVEVQDDGPFPMDARLDCRPGEILALVGPSGSGKTRILRTIAGLYRATRGRVAYGDDAWWDSAAGIELTPQQRRVGFVFQNYALFPHLTALDNVAEALLDRPRAERRARARELLEMVHLGGLEHRKPGALSGGQQQRVAVARALACDPRVLLLDEPFSAVDKATRIRLYRELADLRRQLQMPTVLVTHDLEEATLLADRLSILHRGRTLQDGLPEDVMSKPLTPTIARLVGLNNIFEGHVLEHRPEDGTTLLGWGPYRLEAAHQPDFPAGADVAWVVPEHSIVLHRPDRPSAGENENPVSGVITELFRLGGRINFAIVVDGTPALPLFLSVPTHVARRHGLEVGHRIGASLLVSGIHLMPPAAEDDS